MCAANETWAIPRTLPPQRLTDDAERERRRRGSASGRSGSASASLPWACSSIARLLMEVSVRGCSLLLPST